MGHSFLSSRTRRISPGTVALATKSGPYYVLSMRRSPDVFAILVDVPVNVRRNAIMVSSCPEAIRYASIAGHSTPPGYLLEGRKLLPWA